MTIFIERFGFLPVDHSARTICCGGGGGTLLTPYREERLYYGRRKIEQIKRTEAEMVVLPCHSCHGQIKAALEDNGMSDIPVKYL